MAQQNCNVCEYAHCNMRDGDDGYCYIFSKKPKGRCSQFYPIMPKEHQQIKRQVQQMFPEFGVFLK